MTLLGFFEALQAAPGRMWWQGFAMAKAGQAEQRVERILAWKGAVAMGMKKSIVVVAAILALPAVCVVASAHRANNGMDSQGVSIAQDQKPPQPGQRTKDAPNASSDPGYYYS